MVENPTSETVVFRCFTKLYKSTYSALAPRTGSGEIKLGPGEIFTMSMTFIEKATKGLDPGLYALTVELVGIPYHTNSETFQII